MTTIKLLVGPIRRVVSFPLVQLMAAIAVILWLQAADENSIRGHIFNALDWLTQFTVQVCAALFEVRSFTRSWLTTFFMIAYVYVAGLIIIDLARAFIAAATNVAARWNVLGLRGVIARERGVAAYRAWLPLEAIRPSHVPQDEWEERFAWPAHGGPPYPSLARRVASGAVIYIAAAAIVVALLQAFTPLPAATWLADAARSLWGHLAHSGGDAISR